MAKPKRSEPHTTTVVPKYIRERIEKEQTRSSKQPAKAGKPSTPPAGAGTDQENK